MKILKKFRKSQTAVELVKAFNFPLNFNSEFRGKIDENINFFLFICKDILVISDKYDIFA